MCNNQSQNTLKTIVYVLGPYVTYEDYKAGKPVKWVKIGQTDADVSTKDNESAAYKRCQEVCNTGMPEVALVYDWFSFPKNGNVDDKIRRMLRQMYSGLMFSKTLKCPNEKAVKPGSEFVYDVTSSQIRNAVVAYSYDILMTALAEGQAETNFVYERLKENMCSEDVENVEEPESHNTKFWEEVNKLSNRNLQNNGRTYAGVGSNKHKDCIYVAAFSKKRNTMYVDFEYYPKKDDSVPSSYQTEYRDIIQTAIEDNPPKNLFFGLDPLVGAKRKDKWSWRSERQMSDDEHENIQWIADTINLMWNYFENLEFSK